jgi:DNA-binding winged helix-turn-helix (wHTH) protein/tetratricopeptide (TPR) repeat protein
MRISIDGGWVDLSTREVHRDGAIAQLRHKEAELLGYLADRMGKVVPREELLVEVWGYHPDSRSRTLDTTVRRIRARIEPEPSAPRYLQTAPGVGYRLVLPASHERSWLHDALDQAPVVALWGPPGVGKSWHAQRLAERWEGPVLRGWPPPAAGPGALVILDPYPEELSLEELIRWAQRPGGARVLLVRRTRPRHPAPLALSVPPLSREAARALFVRWAPLAAPVEASDELLEPLGGLPGALLLAARLGEAVGLEALRERLASGGLSALREAGGHELAAALEQSVSRLPPELLPALQRLAAVPVHLQAELASAVVGDPAVLGDLLDAGVVTRDEGGRLGLLPLLREVLPAPPQARTRAGERVGGWCAQRVHPLLGPRTAEERRMMLGLGPVLHSLAPHAPEAELAYAWWCRSEGRDEPLLPHAPPLVRAHLAKLPPEEALSLVEPLPPSPEREAVRIRLLRRLGRLDEAVAARPSDGEHGLMVGEWAYQLYLTYRHRGELVMAETWASRALREWAEASELAVAARLATGDVAVMQGELSQAEDAYTRVLDDPVDPVRRMEARFGLARVALIRQDGEAAIAWTTQAIQDPETVAARTAADVLYNGAVLLREAGAWESARRAALDGLQLSQRTLLPAFVTRRLRLVLGSVLLDAGQPAEAVATLVRAGPLEDPRHVLLLSAAYLLSGQPALARDGVAQVSELVHGRVDRDGHWLKVLGWAILGEPDPEGLAAAALFAVQTFDPALTASVAVLSGQEPDPRTLACSFEARLVLRLDGCHTSSHRDRPLLR